MPVRSDNAIEITAFEWVPSFARGQVRDLRPRWACEEFGLPYSVRLISAIDRPEWYFAQQPWGQVPFMRDGNIEIFESGAMLIHLAQKAGTLPSPGTQDLASILSWLFAALNSVEPGIFELANVFHFSSRTDWAKARQPSLLNDLGKRLARLEANLDREWLASTFSIADIAMTTVLRTMASIEQGRQLLQDLPHIAAYLDRAMARPAFARAIAAQLEPFDRHQPAR